MHFEKTELGKQLIILKPILKDKEEVNPSELTKEATSYLSGGYRSISIDFSNIKYISSFLINALKSTGDALRKSDCGMSVVIPNNFMYSIVKGKKIGIDLYASIEELEATIDKDELTSESPTVDKDTEAVEEEEPPEAEGNTKSENETDADGLDSKLAEDTDAVEEEEPPKVEDNAESENETDADGLDSKSAEDTDAVEEEEPPKVEDNAESENETDADSLDSKSVGDAEAVEEDDTDFTSEFDKLSSMFGETLEDESVEAPEDSILSVEDALTEEKPEKENPDSIISPTIIERNTIETKEQKKSGIIDIAGLGKSIGFADNKQELSGKEQIQEKVPDTTIRRTSDNLKNELLLASLEQKRKRSKLNASKKLFSGPIPDIKEKKDKPEKKDTQSYFSSPEGFDGKDVSSIITDRNPSDLKNALLQASLEEKKKGKQKTPTDIPINTSIKEQASLKKEDAPAVDKTPDINKKEDLSIVSNSYEMGMGTTPNKEPAAVKTPEEDPIVPEPFIKQNKKTEDKGMLYDSHNEKKVKNFEDEYESGSKIWIVLGVVLFFVSSISVVLYKTGYAPKFTDNYLKFRTIQENIFRIKPSLAKTNGRQIGSLYKAINKNKTKKRLVSKKSKVKRKPIIKKETKKPEISFEAGEKFGTIFIATRPALADIYFNDKFVGVSSKDNIKLPIGKVVLDIRKNGVSTIKEFDIKEGKNLPLYVILPVQ